MTLTNTGRNTIRNLVSGGSTEYPTHGAVGSDTTAATVTDTTLGSETIRKTFETVDDTTNYETTFETWIASTEGNGTTMAECGLFTAASAGSMINRNTFTPLAKNSETEVLIEQKITYTEG